MMNYTAFTTEFASKRLAPILAVIFIAKIALHCMFQYDVWDGLLLDYAFSTNNYSGSDIFFRESGWITQKYLFEATTALANFLSAPHFLLSDILAEAAIFFSSLTIASIAREQGVHPFVGLSLAVLYSLSPPLMSATSSIMLFHVVTALLIMLCVRIYITELKYRLCYITPLMILASGYHAWIVLLPVYLVLIDASKAQPNHGGWIVDLFRQINASRYQYVILATVSIFCLVIYRMTYPPHGLYEGYNQIILDQKNLIYITAHSLRNVSNLWLVILACLILRMTRRRELGYALTGGLLSVILFGLAGKSFALTPSFDFGDRQGIPLLVFICAVMPVLTTNKDKQTNTVNTQIFVISSASLLLLACIYLVNIISLEMRETFMRDLASEISDHQDLVTDAAINDLIIPNQPWGQIITGQELNPVINSKLNSQRLWFESGTTAFHKPTNLYFPTKTLILDAYRTHYGAPRSTVTLTNNDSRNCVYVDHIGYDLQGFLRLQLARLSGQRVQRTIRLHKTPCANNYLPAKL